jgi:NAD(P)-dependent dehydrogenase (short-subunit alcohol dehydrogenase family)
MPDQRVVLITGASSGVGQSTARLLAERGGRKVARNRFERDAAVALSDWGTSQIGRTAPTISAGGLYENGVRHTFSI